MERAVDFTKAVEKFGGFSELARRLDVPLSTCHGWHRRNKIPPWRAKTLVALAEAENIDIWKKKRKRRATRKVS